MESKRIAIVFFLGKRVNNADCYVYQCLSSGIKNLVLVPLKIELRGLMLYLDNALPLQQLNSWQLTERNASLTHYIIKTNPNATNFCSLKPKSSHKDQEAEVQKAMSEN